MGKVLRGLSANLEKVEALVATGMPGAYKVLIFFVIQKIHGLSELGNLATYQSVAQIFGYFTAIGWCSLILVRVPKEEARKKRLIIFNELLLMASFTLAALMILLFAVSLVLGFVGTAVEIVFWMGAWTYYQIPRHYFVSQKRYRSALVLDVLVILGSLLICYISESVALSRSLAGFMFVSGVGATLALQDKKPSWPKRLFFDSKGLEYGMVNLLTGGIILSLVPLASTLEGEDFAGALSMFIALTGVALLIPRAVSINLMPELAKNSSNKYFLKLSIYKMQRQISISNIFTTAFCVAVAVFIAMAASQSNSKMEALFVFLLIILQGSLGIQSLTYFNALMVQEKSRELLKLNAISFSIFVVTVCLLSLLETEFAMNGISFTLVLLSAYRFFGAKSLALGDQRVILK